MSADQTKSPVLKMQVFVHSLSMNTACKLPPTPTPSVIPAYERESRGGGYPHHRMLSARRPPAVIVV